MDDWTRATADRRPLMVAVLLLLANPLLPGTSGLARAQEPGASATAGHYADLASLPAARRFDFLLGAWSYDFTQGAGTVTYESVLDGEAIRETLLGSISGTTFAGSSLAWHDAPAGIWRRRWIDTLGNSIAGEARLEEYGESQMVAMVSEFSLGGTRFRHVWYDISADRFMTDLLVQAPGAREYSLVRRMPYVRRLGG